jgi:hypothetical protein
MSEAAINLRHVSFALALAAALLLISATSANAAALWGIHATSETNAAPGATIVTVAQIEPADEEALPTAGGNEENCVAGAPEPAEPAKCVRVSATFPVGLTPSGVDASYEGIWTCETVGQTVNCSEPGNQVSIDLRGDIQQTKLIFTAEVDPGAAGILTTTYEVSGGEADAPATTVDPIQVSAELPEFGLEAFDTAATADESGALETKAGAHPYEQRTYFDHNSYRVEPEETIGRFNPVAGNRDILVDLPPGFLGNPEVLAQCTTDQLANGIFVEQKPLCPEESQVGKITLRFSKHLGALPQVTATPLYNMLPPPGTVARFGFNVIGTLVMLDARLHPDAQGRYVVSVGGGPLSNAVSIKGTQIDIWGVPSDPSHTFWRHCAGQLDPPFYGSCPSTADPLPFLRMPTSCDPAGQPWAIHTDAWGNAGAKTAAGNPVLADPRWKSREALSHQSPGYPYDPSDWGAPIVLEDCDDVPFKPTVSIAPTTNEADSPSGLHFELQMPQEGFEDANAISEADLRRAVVTLPEGMKVNPSAASGQASCSSAQIGLSSPAGQAPIVFNDAPQSCPDAAKIGTAEIQTPVLEQPIKGDLYLAAQGDNPFKSLLSVYLVIEDPMTGITLKLAGAINVDPNTGQLRTTFDNNPQLPFSKLTVDLFGGSRAALRTPARCGSYQALAELAPWSGTPAEELASPFEISSGPHGTPCPSGALDPKFSAGMVNPLAGAHSPFVLRLSREDGTAEIGGISVVLPKGLLASLGGIPYCPDSALASIPTAEGTGAAQLASPACPAASALGTVTVGAGAGPTPFYTQTGRAYWSGPYKGAPISLAVVVPALAGPFDLGNVVVRTRFEVEPETAKITAIADPLPASLYGIPLDVRDVRVDLDRPNYTLNPTSCDPMSFEAEISSLAGAVAHRSERFQVGGCERLAFKPKLSLALKGGTKRADHPALRAVLTMPKGGANIARAQVTLPHSAFIDQSHFQTICTRVQYAAGAGGGAECPKGSIYGRARVYSPILGYYLQGPVFLRSAPQRELPDLVISLNGQIHVDVVGHIDSHNKGIRTTFDPVPDAPVSKFVLEMQGGRKGLVQNSTDLCKGTHRATAFFDAQNGKTRDVRPELVPDCGKKSKKKKHSKGY